MKTFLEALKHVPYLQDVLSPLPIEYYISKLRDEINALTDAYLSGIVEAVAYHACRIVAIAVQVLDRAVNIKEVLDKLGRVEKSHQVGILT